MKKILISLIIIIFGIVLFFNLKEEKSSSKEITTEIKKDKPISNSQPLIKKELKNKNDNPNKEKLPKLDLELKVDKTEFYKNQKYDTVSSPKTIKEEKKEKNFDYDVNIDVNKKTKEIEGFNINLEKKF